jgi:phosphohistidine phosphatase
VKTLLLLRHAKSSWDDPALEDFDRPLAPRGKRDAPRMGELIRSSGVDVDLVVCSKAARAKETLKLAAKAAKADWSVEYTDEIYEASAQRLADLVRRLPNDADTVLLVGHNPGFEDLVRYLCSPDAGMSVTMPTAALACLAFESDRWEDAGKGAGALRWLVVPKVLAD